MFSHAVINLLADKAAPKLRLKFRPAPWSLDLKVDRGYHNPDLHAQMALQKQTKEEQQQQQLGCDRRPPTCQEGSAGGELRPATLPRLAEVHQLLAERQRRSPGVSGAAHGGARY